MMRTGTYPLVKTFASKVTTAQTYVALGSMMCNLEPEWQRTRPVSRIRPPSQGDVELLERLTRARADLLAQVGRRIVGQHQVLDGILTAIFSGGHALLLGVPGLAKTLMVQTVAQTLDLKFCASSSPRSHATDITGTEIIEEDQATGKRAFRFVRGPVFANIVLADEVNRTPPKTQAALLQAMQEHQVTAAGQTHPCRRRSSCSPPRTRSSRRGPIPCPRRSSTASCSNCEWPIPPKKKKRRSSRPPRGPRHRDRAGADSRGCARAAAPGAPCPRAEARWCARR